MVNGGPVQAVTSARRLHMVWTRPLDGQPLAGRVKVALAIRGILRDMDPDLRETVLPSLITAPSLTRAVATTKTFVTGLAASIALPVQSAIYASDRDMRAIVDSIPEDVDAIYLDGVRTFSLLRLLRERRPHQRIVVDLDDLMSRRMALLLSLGEPPSPGYLSGRIPRPVQRLLQSPRFTRALLKYERWSLEQTERAILDLADAVVLLSSEDRAALAGRPGRRAEIFTVPPFVTLRREPRPLLNDQLRFVFVGTDALTQNRLTIDYLLAIWRRHQIAAPLTIFGEQRRSIDLPAGVTIAGYVDSIDDIYDGRSILLSPTFLRGGIKTKVLEGFAYGAPVIGNAATFEAMDIGDYPLKIEGEDEDRKSVV